MSYLVLARKYRPRNFTEMVGQEHVVQALTNALTQQRLHHAYLFTGTRGVGKTTVSRILAKSLNCTGADGQGGITSTPCGMCPACREIDSGRFPDYVELDAASNRGVDEVQSLLEQAVYKPVQGRFKVFMIDEVHMLTNTAFNAMLKTLEEPPEYLKFVLATTDPQKVPVTVLSRCLQFNLRPMAPETVFEHLTRVLEQESITAEPQALKLLARGARGSMRDALSLTDQAIAFGCGQLQEAGVRQMLGSVDRSYVFRLIDALAQGDGRTVVETVDTLRHHGIGAASTLEELCTLLQRMAVLQAVPSMADATDPTDPDATELLRLAQTMAADETQLLYSIGLHGRQELGLAPDEYAALTMVLLRLLAFQAPAADGTAEKKTLKTAPASAPAATTTAAAVVTQPPSAPASTAPVPAATVPPAAPVVPASVAPAATRPAVLPPATTTAPVARPAPAPAPASVPVAAAAPAAPATPPDGDIPPWEDIPDSAYAEDMGHSASAPVSAAQAMPDPAPAAAQAPRATPPAPAAPTFSAPQPTATSAAAAPAVHAVPEMPSSPLGDFWHATVGQLVADKVITKLTRELALQSELIARDGAHWTVCTDRNTLNRPDTCEQLTQALAAFGCQQLTVEPRKAHDTPALRNRLHEQARQLRAEAMVHNDPGIQALMQTYGATIVPGSIRPL